MKPLIKGDVVDVRQNLGVSLGMQWSRGKHTFENYEAPEDHPLARVGLAPREPMCLVRVVGGFSDGLVVRYKATNVRSQVKP